MEIKSDSYTMSQFNIRTSDRRVFRRCLRKWDYQSSLRQNLTRVGTEQNINFWFGSAIHFCMEDYHGYNRFQDPRRALYAYYHAFKADEMPLGAEMHYSLGISMLTYYMQWMERHNRQTGFQTVWMDPKTYQIREKGDEGAVPAVEIQFYFPLHVYAVVDLAQDKIIDAFCCDPENDSQVAQATFRSREHCMWVPDEWSPDSDPDHVYSITVDGHEINYKIIGINYHGTIDRIVVDQYGRYWLWDYKTAKSADTAKLATDDQVSAYLYAARKLFPFPVYGFVYLQMTKERVQPPKRLKNGQLSRDKRQKTTYGLLRQEIINDYGEVNKAPSELIEFLNHMAATEEPEGDRFIRWDFVKRNDSQLDATERAIYGELSVMLNPNLYCYPTPTRDCSWDCPLREACIASDQGDNSLLQEILAGFVKRSHSDDGNEDSWRGGIAWPRSNSDGTTDLMPLEDVLNYDEAIVPILPEEDTNDGFRFLYEDDC